MKLTREDERPTSAGSQSLQIWHPLPLAAIFLLLQQNIPLSLQRAPLLLLIVKRSRRSLPCNFVFTT